MRILIVGAGIAGLTLAALLRQRGLHPTLIERAGRIDTGGYALGLYPLGTRVLHGLGLHDAFVVESVPYEACDVTDGRGRVIRRFDVRSLFEEQGALRGISRGALMRLLAQGAEGLDLRLSTQVARIEQADDHATVALSDGTREDWDLVVGADGLRSPTRAYVGAETDAKDTGWACWTWWTMSNALPPGRLMECWGVGRMLGLYPSERGIGVVACAPRRDLAEAREGRAARIRALFPAMEGPAADVVASAPEDDADAFYWPLADARAQRWTRGRVTLLGDAACAFLPTAGIGASMALESAAVFADELSRTDAAHIPSALRFTELRRRKRCEAAQRDSRFLARLMFLESRWLDGPRAALLRVARPRDLVRQIFKMAEAPI